MSAEDFDRYLTGIQIRDEREFGRWMALVEPRLRATLRTFASHIDVEAVLQETFLRIWQIAPKFKSDGRPNSLLRFTFRCARNLAISGMRRADRIEDVEDLDRALLKAGESVAPVESDPALRRILIDCASNLPTQPRQALAARVAGGGVEPDRTLADRLGMRLNTFLQNITRARKLLLACLERAGVDLGQQLA